MLLPLLLPFAVLAVPFVDLALAVVRRTRAGRSPFAPDKEHLHHRLMEIGHSHTPRRAGHVQLDRAARLRHGRAVRQRRRALLVLAGLGLAVVAALVLSSVPRLRAGSR